MGSELNKGQVLAYIRVSSEAQNEARQEEALSKYFPDKVFMEKVSGKSMKDRVKLNEMLNYAREGDTIVVHDFSRLARSTKDLLAILDICNEKKVNLISNKENLDTSTPTGKLMVTMLAAIYEFERENIKERQAEGIEVAKKNGKYKGGHKKKIDEDKYQYLKNKYFLREINKREFAEKLGVSAPTLRRILSEEKRYT